MKEFLTGSPERYITPVTKIFTMVSKKIVCVSSNESPEGFVWEEWD